MKYCVSPIWFYLINTADYLKMFLSVVSGVALLLLIFAFAHWIYTECIDISDMDDDDKKEFNSFKKAIKLCFITFFISLVLIPSKANCVEMMVASKVTYENVGEVKQEVFEIVDYVVDKMNQMDE